MSFRIKLIIGVSAIGLLIAFVIWLTDGPPSEAKVITAVEKCVLGPYFDRSLIQKIEIQERFQPSQETIIRDGTTRSQETVYLVNVNIIYKDGNSEARSVNMFRKGIYWYAAGGNNYINISH